MRIIISLFLLIYPMVAFTHSDFGRIHKYGNVEIIVITGFDYEIRNKIQITGQLVDLLLKDMKYDNKVHIHIQHQYVEDYFKGKEYYISSDSSKTINIEGRLDKLNIEEILKLVESSVNYGCEKMMRNQKTFMVNSASGNSKLEKISISDKQIKTMLCKKTSKRISNILASNKIFRPGDSMNINCDMTYFFKDNKYYFIGRTYSNGDTKEYTELLVLDDFHKAVPIENRSMLIFDTDSSFIFISTKVPGTFILPRKKISKRHIFDNNDTYYPINVALFGGNKLALSVLYNKRFHYYYQTMVYYINDDILVTDVDKKILGNFPIQDRK